jgi:hypothetical protein
VGALALCVKSGVSRSPSGLKRINLWLAGQHPDAVTNTLPSQAMSIFGICASPPGPVRANMLPKSPSALISSIRPGSRRID